MQTTNECSENASQEHGRTPQEIQTEILRVVDKLMACPKSQTDGLVQKLRTLWRKRTTALSAETTTNIVSVGKEKEDE